MKKLLTLLALACCVVMTAGAQGNVTVTQSADIDALVNGKKTAAKTKEQIKAEKKAAKKAEKEARKRTKELEKLNRAAVRNGMLVPSNASTPESRKISVPRLDNHKIEAPRVVVSPTPTSPHTKWVMRKVRHPRASNDSEAVGRRTVVRRVLKTTKKVRGFRVQAYSGGNTRVARQNAEKAGQAVKAIYPNLPVYVHFYSPRWMCQVGNFTSYEQARKVMRKLKASGIPHASIIRTMVTLKTSTPVD